MAGAFLWALIFLLVYRAGNSPVHFFVEPASSAATVTQEWQHASLLRGGILEINNPDIFQKLLLPSSSTSSDPLFLIGILFITGILYRILAKIERFGLFEAAIGGLIRLLGWGLIIHALLFIYRTVIWLPTEISNLTNGQYTPIKAIPFASILELWFAVIILLCASAYDKASILKREQALTI